MCRTPTSEMLMLSVYLSLFSAFFLVVSGQCGFPGKPLNGKVFTVQNPEIKETSWGKEEIPRVEYRCDTGLLTVGHVRSGYYRECVNGTWTGEIPQCVETTNIVKILHHYDDRNTFTYSINEQGMLSEEFPILKKQPVVVYLHEKRRLSGIRISSETSGPDAISFQKAKFSFVGGEENALQIGYERINLNESSLFAFTNLTEELSSISVELVHPHGFFVCRLGVYAFPNECGHPEIPVDGTVKWQSGSPNAEYSCKDGYELDSENQTRICENGKWSGSQPACRFKGIAEADKGTDIIIRFCVAVVIFAVLVGLALTYLKN